MEPSIYTNLLYSINCTKVLPNRVEGVKVDTDHTDANYPRSVRKLSTINRAFLVVYTEGDSMYYLYLIEDRMKSEDTAPVGSIVDGVQLASSMSTLIAVDSSSPMLYNGQ